MLEKAIQGNIGTFTDQLQKHFDDMLVNGREVRLTVKKWETWENDLESEYDGEELTEHIIHWIAENTVNKSFNLSDATENFLRFEQVRIPLYGNYDIPMDARSFGKGLQKHLKKAPFEIDVKLMTRGLGEVILVLGEK
jgi:hypothetical protein